MRMLLLLVVLACGTPSGPESLLAPRPLDPPRYQWPFDSISGWPAFPDSGYGRDPRPEFHQRVPRAPRVPRGRSKPRCLVIPVPLLMREQWALFTLPRPELVVLPRDCDGVRV